MVWLRMQVTVEATLPHTAAVYHLAWHELGNWLAVSTVDQRVLLWRPDFGGDWRLTTRIEGVPDTSTALAVD